MQGVLGDLCLSAGRISEPGLQFCAGDPEVPDGTSLHCSLLLLHHLTDDLAASCISAGEGRGAGIERSVIFQDRISVFEMACPQGTQSCSLL